MEINPYDDDDFVALVEDSQAFAKARQGELTEIYGISTCTRWYTRQCDDVLFFFEGDDPAIGFKCQSVGTYSMRSFTWMWAWANKTVLDSGKDAALKVLDFGKEHGFTALITDCWKCTDISDAWAMASVAAKLVNAMGIYRTPVLYSDVKDILEKQYGIKIGEDMEKEAYSYSFDLFMDVLDGSEINVNCVMGEGKCPGMIVSGGKCVM